MAVRPRRRPGLCLSWLLRLAASGCGRPACRIWSLVVAGPPLGCRRRRPPRWGPLRVGQLCFGWVLVGVVCFSRVLAVGFYPARRPRRPPALPTARSTGRRHPRRQKAPRAAPGVSAGHPGRPSGWVLVGVCPGFIGGGRPVALPLALSCLSPCVSGRGGRRRAGRLRRPHCVSGVFSACVFYVNNSLFTPGCPAWYALIAQKYPLTAQNLADLYGTGYYR